MKYLLPVLLFVCLLLLGSTHVAQALTNVPPVGTSPIPSPNCLGSCPTTAVSPSQSVSSAPSSIPSAAPSAATSVAPSQSVSSAPSNNPSPSSAPCTASAAVSSQSVSSHGSVSALHHGHAHHGGGGKKHSSGNQGLLQQFIQFLLQLLQQLFKQLGISLPIPGSGCPTPSPSGAPSAAPSSSVSNSPSSAPSGSGGGGPSTAPSANPSTGVPTPTIFGVSPSPSSGVPTTVPTSGGATQKTNCTPAKNATMTNTVSSKCGFPDTTNTGATGTLVSNPTGPSANTGSGWTASGGTINVTTNGAVVKNISTSDTINVQASNVTIDNVKIISPATQWFGIDLRGATNVVIEHSTIAGTNATSGRMEAAIKDIEEGSTFSANSMIKANNIYYVGTGIQVDHGTIEDNYIHDMGYISGDHLNGTTSNSGDDGTLMTIQHNTVFNSFDQTDAISLFEDFGVQENRVISDNLVAGGGYCMYGGQNPGGPAISNIKITNNHFSKMYYPECGGQGGGIIAAFTTSGTGNVWSGNVWDDTGATIPN